MTCDRRVIRVDLSRESAAMKAPLPPEPLLRAGRTT